MMHTYIHEKHIYLSNHKWESFDRSHPIVFGNNIVIYSLSNTTMYEPFYYQLMHIMLKNTELLKHSKITLQHVSVYVETIFRELQSVLG